MNNGTEQQQNSDSQQQAKGKRPRWDQEASEEKNNEQPPIKKPAVNLEAIQRAKKALALKKQLVDKKKQSAAQVVPPPVPQTVAEDLPFESTQTVPLQPALLQTTIPPPAPESVSKQDLQYEQQQQARIEAQKRASMFFDPRMQSKGGSGRRGGRRRRNFEFVQAGEYQKQAELQRIKAKYGQKAIEQVVDDVETLDLEAVHKLGEQLEHQQDIEQAAVLEDPAEEVPEIEWWDSQLLLTKSYENILQQNFDDVNFEKITHYVLHPVPSQPPNQKEAAIAQPLKLTQRESKKLRTQRRLEREREKQDLIRQGLLEPPKPKVKISNMMRVYGASGVMDPTAIDQKVQAAMKERQQAHEDRNLSRKLTPMERRQKKMRQLFGVEEDRNNVCVYKVTCLDAEQTKIKVRINATQNQLTGCAVISEKFCLVVVEGSKKSINRFKKLMLRRINWDQGLEEEQLPNACHLVWEGNVIEPCFKEFQIHHLPTEVSVRELLNQFGGVHYWDIAKQYKPDDNFQQNKL